jgi:hypothetical protein
MCALGINTIVPVLEMVVPALADCPPLPPSPPARTRPLSLFSVQMETVIGAVPKSTLIQSVEKFL